MTAVTTRDALAEALSWTSGEMTRYSDTAHPDHNRWSWRGYGHREEARQDFLDQADALIASGVVVDVATLADDEALDNAVAQAIGDPGSIVGRQHHLGESVPRWATRAVWHVLAAALTERAR